MGKYQEDAMEIAIIGAGNVGKALGTGWRKAGHQVLFGMRDPAGEKAAAVKAEEFAVASPREAAAQASVIVLALPWRGIEDSVKALGPLGGKIVVDATNPLSPSLDLAIGHNDSAGETVARNAPGAKVVKAFNTTGFGNMSNSAYPGGKLMMTVAGDDAAAKLTVMSLATDLGFDPVDAGPLVMSRYLEPLAMVWIKLAMAQKMGSNFGFAILRR
jgi:predicted dinucleotide-binding enzyme